MIQLFATVSFVSLANEKLVWRDKNIYTNSGTMVHVMHVHFLFLAIFKNLKIIIFRRQHVRTYPRHFH